MKTVKQLRFILLFVLILIVLVSIRQYSKNYFIQSAEQVFEMSLDTAFYLSPQELSVLDVNYTLVDLRDKEDFKTSHLENAIHIELGNLLDKSNQKSLKKSEKIILYADDISKSVKAKSLLNQLGYSTIYVLTVSANMVLNEEIKDNSLNLNNEAFKYKFQPDTTINPE